MAVAVDRARWVNMGNVMRAIDTRVAQARLSGVDADPWAAPADDASQEGWLDRAAARLREVRDAVKRAKSKGEARAAQLADDVAGLVSDAATQGKRIAHDIGSRTEDAFDRIVKTTDEILTGAATGFGVGIGTIIVIAYLLLRRD